MLNHARKSLLQKFLDRKSLSYIDVAYACIHAKEDNLEELALHAATFFSFRLGHLCLEKKIIEDKELASLLPEGRIYLPKCAEIEDQIIKHIQRLLSYTKQQEIEFSSFPDLTKEQNHAVRMAKSCSLSLLTGGPGTGKTHTACRIIEIFNCPTLVLAPTGRAASHLLQKSPSSVKGGTLHSWLLQQEDYLDANLIIVDECSMIDPPLFVRLLSCIGPHTTLILMGDADQLPAVEGGSIFADLLDSTCIPTTKLSIPLRSERKELVELATHILCGNFLRTYCIDLGFSKGHIPTIYQNLWEYVQNKDFSSFRILSTLRKGPLGVDALNAFLFEKFYKETASIPIMITKNDRQTGLANGDTGFLKKGRAFFKDSSFAVEELPPYEYAYCLSVHKSQGSEYEEVLFLVPEGSEYFGREVLYTAVTRAKKKIAIDGSDKEITAALGKTSRKLSGICEKLQLSFLTL